ncbi:hypothetical protein COO03_11815 [Bacillus sp. AFS098217]|uniref:hypothetical protein n=1 Tax=unclassified Bacillus (in: firmicutes) TaxID=185979 RepID=UPI000BEC9751|nr:MULTISPECIES: hypothetical protein [unclassified Bacillus (in: firmicutes)]PEB52466.1 hypothetical protein COO03_11815 [Bacillus sp. AFS098217]PEU20361.1 hypothetical protein CN525_04580 [Bacillus sp. AFS014408]
MAMGCIVGWCQLCEDAVYEDEWEMDENNDFFHGKCFRIRGTRDGLRMQLAHSHKTCSKLQNEVEELRKQVKELEKEKRELGNRNMLDTLDQLKELVKNKKDN